MVGEKFGYNVHPVGRNVGSSGEKIEKEGEGIGRMSLVAKRIKRYQANLTVLLDLRRLNELLYCLYARQQSA